MLTEGPRSETDERYLTPSYCSRRTQIALVLIVVQIIFEAVTTDQFVWRRRQQSQRAPARQSQGGMAYGSDHKPLRWDRASSSALA